MSADRINPLRNPRMEWFDQQGPLPGMIAAFENHYGQSWTDKEWRDEASIWAAAWKAALAAQPAQAVQVDAEDAARERRYQFLLGFLIERGVLTDKRYGNGTWSLQGIYGVDDSGLRGAGRSPEEALDNAIVASNLDPEAARKFWSGTHDAIADWLKPIADAYGYLWHVNNEPMAPIPLYSPEKAAYEARKRLRDLLTHEQRGEAINRVGRSLGKYSDDDAARALAGKDAARAQPAQPGEQR